MKILSALFPALLMGLALPAAAADLNKPAHAAVDYVRVCDAYGAGFFYIPGSDTCLKISGFVRIGYEYGASNTLVGRGSVYTGSAAAAGTGPGATRTAASVFGGVLVTGQRGQNSSDTYSRNEIQFDARTNTEYGLLRSYIDYNLNINTSASNSAVTFVRLDRAMIQFGGLTAGRALSYFNFYGGATFAQNYGEMTPNNPVNLLAYTISPIKGLTATLSLEDPTSAGLDHTATAAPAPNYVMRRGGATFVYGGLNMPDVVATLNLDQSWGSAQISAAAHQDYGATNAIGTKWGYAVLAGVRYKLPTIAPGDEIYLEGTYTNGAVGYADWQGSFFLLEKSAGVGATTSATDLGADATYSLGSGIKQTRAWSVFGGFTHFLTPQHEIDFSAGYLREDGYNQNASGPIGYGNSTFGQFEAALQLQWMPIRAVQISPYVEYRHIDFTSGTQAAYGVAKSADAFNGGLRVQRNF